MSDYVKRTSYFRANRYQIPIIGLTLVPTFILCGLLTVFVLFVHKEIITYIQYDTTLRNVEMINQGGFLMLITIWSFFTIVYAWSKIVSSRLVGAFDRIIRELDRVIEGEKIDSITARDDDYIASLLLPRINFLIKKTQPEAVPATASTY